jgi:hypothetical protein
VPRNFLKKLQRPVRLKPAETCGWERHFEWGYAARSISRQLLRMDSVQKHGVCFAKDIKAIQKGARKFRDGKQVGKFSYNTVQDTLLMFEKVGFISPRFTMDEGPYAGLEVFEVYGQKMHDALCHRAGNICRYVGWNLPVHRQKGTQSGTQALEKGTQQGTQAGTPVFEKRNPVGNPSKMLQDSQNEQVAPIGHQSDLRNGAPNQLSQVNHKNQALESSSGQGEPGTPKPKAAFSLSSRPDLTQNQRQPAITVGVHVGKPVTVKQVSDGELDIYSVDFDEWLVVEEMCAHVVEDWKDQPFLGRETLGDIMGEVMGRIRSRYQMKLPPAWYKVVKKLRAGGPPKLEPGWNPPPPPVTDEG